MSAIRKLLEADHRRLDGLVEQATSSAESVDPAPFDAFRRGLLRHIAIEEKVLFAEAKRLRGGVAIPAAAQLRLDHAAIAAILAARPTPGLVRALRALLVVHNSVEEGTEGVYAQCEDACAAELPTLLERIDAVPAVRVAAWVDPARIEREIRRALDAAYRARGVVPPAW